MNNEEKAMAKYAKLRAALKTAGEKGLTEKQVMKIGGWSESYVQRACTKAGVKLGFWHATGKQRGVWRYYWNGSR